MMGRRHVTMLVLTFAFVTACGGGENPLQVAVGECFDDPDVVGGRVHELTLTACDEPHDNEVYAVVELTEGPFPGVGEVSTIADEACLGAFEPYVGEPYLEASFFASYLAPTEGSWAEGDRTIACFLFDQSGPSVGSARPNGG